jgi:hypothetical protein
MLIFKVVIRILIGFFLLILIGSFLRYVTHIPMSVQSSSQLLSDPFLQLPAQNSVYVVWFTEFAGTRHTVVYGNNLENEVLATTTQLSRTQEDSFSYYKDQTKENPIFLKPTPRKVWRHEAKVERLKSGERIPYRVISIQENGRISQSEIFALAPAPLPEKPLKILLTSDHQLMPMTTANLQKVEETIGKVDAVFLAGDLVNVPDRASEWFDDDRGGGFFPALQGRGNYELEKEGNRTVYRGGKIIQYAPLFPAIGNHEVMGRSSPEKNLKEQFSDAHPHDIATQFYHKNAQVINPKNEQIIKENWIKNQSFNTDTYEEIFTLPQSSPGRKKYYAVTFGDIRLVVPYITNIWRPYLVEPNIRGRYQERKEDFENPEAWGYGQHIFEPIQKGSPQYNWLLNELNSEAFKQAKYKVVMFHHPPHTLGDNIVPAYTDPVQIIERDAKGKITSIRYEYPKENDYIIRDVIPLLEAAGVDLVFYGHSHLWNRFMSADGMHFLESSNVGNSYGAYLGDKKRPIPAGFDENYVATGDPNGLLPVMPTLVSVNNKDGLPVPYIASNDLTVFSILDTGEGTVSSYYFDTRKPASEVVKFDVFQLGNPVSKKADFKTGLWLILASLLSVSGILTVALLLADRLKDIGDVWVFF